MTKGEGGGRSKEEEKVEEEVGENWRKGEREGRKKEEGDGKRRQVDQISEMKEGKGQEQLFI